MVFDGQTHLEKWANQMSHAGDLHVPPKILMGNARILTRVMATYCAILGETNSCASLTYQGYYFGLVFFSLEMLGVILCNYIYVAIATSLCCTRCDAQKEPSRRSQWSGWWHLAGLGDWARFAD